MENMDELVGAWSDYLKTVDNWQALVKDIEPKVGGCGLVYEIPNPIDRPLESFAIADMRGLEVSEPHRHSNGEIEIYFVIQGLGKIVVGEQIHDLTPGGVIVTPSETMHVTKTDKDLVLVVVNTPPFDVDNYVTMSEADPVVRDALAQLAA
jgi:mannose-6-phosphate isomerase-like protein (cupin superfamily)